LTAESATGTESRAIVYAIAGFIIGGVVGLFVFHDAVPISGRGSLGDATAITCAILALLVFVASYLLSLGQGGREWFREIHLARQILNVAALAFAHAAVALLAWAVLFVVFQLAFIDAEVSQFIAAVLLGAASTITCYFVYLSGSLMTTSRLIFTLVAFLALGVVTSMLTTSDPYWWQKNISALGTGDDFSGATFNLTLLIAGILLSSLSDYLTSDLTHSSLMPGVDEAGMRKRANQIKWALILLGAFLAGVGLFPVDDRQFLHIAVSIGMVIAFGFLVIRVRWLIPGVSTAFVLVGYIFLAIIVVATVLFFIGYWALTAMELIAFALVFTWLIVLIRNVAAAETDAVGVGTDSAAGVRPRV
jgi:hypothetical membrane protein